MKLGLYIEFRVYAHIQIDSPVSLGGEARRIPPPRALFLPEIKTNHFEFLHFEKRSIFLSILLIEATPYIYIYIYIFLYI